MPQRAVSILTGLVGLAALALLVLIGADLLRASQTGPRWKRKLLGAGILLLVAMGMGGYAYVSSARPGRTIERTELDLLHQKAEWKHLQKTWTEAAEIASGKRGNYPFTQKEQVRLQSDMKEVFIDIVKLQEQRLLTDGEAGLLAREMRVLEGEVNRFRPVEMKNVLVLCYAPMMMDVPAQDSLDRLLAELSFLQTMTWQGRLNPDVIGKVMSRIEADLTLLEKDSEIATLPEDKQGLAREIRHAVRVQVDQIHSQMAEEAFQQSEEWKSVVDAWGYVEPILPSGKSTQADRKTANGKLEAARNGIEKLAKAGVLSLEEAGLLLVDAERLKTELYRNPPISEQGKEIMSCYDVVDMPIPAQTSLNRLEQRLPLLTKLAESGKLHPAVLQKMRWAIEGDVKRLMLPQEINQLPGDERGRAREVLDAVRTQMGKLEPYVRVWKEPAGAGGV